MSLRVILLGAPGSGKGTQAKRLAASRALCHLSTGDMLRGAVRARTPIGIEAERFLDAGRLVPDDMIVGMVRDRIRAADCAAGFVLDGFPRTVPQAEALDAMLGEVGTPASGAIHLKVDPEVVVSRIAGRRGCRACGTPYHVDYAPPTVEGVCDACGGAVVQRADDEADTVRRRLGVYDEQARGLIDYYTEKETLESVDGSQPLEAVAAAIEAIVDRWSEG